MRHTKNHLISNRPFAHNTLFTLTISLLLIQTAGGCATANGEHPLRNFNSSVIAQNQPLVVVEDSGGPLVQGSENQSVSEEEEEIVSARMPPLLRAEPKSSTVDKTKKVAKTSTSTEKSSSVAKKVQLKQPKAKIASKQIKPDPAAQAVSKQLSKGEIVEIEEVVEEVVVVPEKEAVTSTKSGETSGKTEKVAKATTGPKAPEKGTKTELVTQKTSVSAPKKSTQKTPQESTKELPAQQKEGKEAKETAGATQVAQAAKQTTQPTEKQAKSPETTTQTCPVDTTTPTVAQQGRQQPPIVIDETSFHYNPREATEYVDDSFRINGIYVHSSTPDQLYTNCKIVRGTFFKNNPRPGDLVFFHNTQDLNGDGKRNDWFSWVAIVLNQKRNGEITFIGWRNNALHKGRMNLNRPTKDPSTTRNSLLRRDQRGINGEEPASNYADQLFAGYCSLMKRRQHFDLIHDWRPRGN